MHLSTRVQTIRKPAATPPDCPPRPPRELDTLVKVARWRAERQAAEVAFTFLADGEQDERHLTYGELDFHARAIAAELQARGARGERVLLIFDPGLEYLKSIFGCLYAGAIAVPVYPPDSFRASRTLPRLQAIVRDAAVRLVLTSREIYLWAGDLLERVCEATILPVETISRDRLLAPRDLAHDPEELALLQYTSGSTGSPRGVMLTHASLMHNCAVIHRLDNEGVIVVSWVPPYHDMGLIGCTLVPMHSGRRMVQMSPLAFAQRPVRWLRAISHYRGKTSAAPNFGYELCIRKVAEEDCAGLDLSSWTVAVNGAEQVRAETIDRFVEKFGPYGFRREAFYPAFGMAEATLMVTGGTRLIPAAVTTFSARAMQQNRVHVVSASSGNGRARRLVSCGRPVPGSEIAIVDPHACRPLPPGYVGEIWFRSPSVGKGYWNQPAETERVFHARLAGRPDAVFLRTGDLGFVYRGELYITGRLKELLIFGGRNYYPQDLERTVERAHPAIKPGGGAAFSIEVAREERLVVVHEVQRPKKFDLGEVLRAIRRELAEEHELLPYAVVLIPSGSLPKTSSGKTRRLACREAFLQGRLCPLAEWRAEPDAQSRGVSGRTVDPPRTPLETALARLWSEVLGIDPIGRDDDFFALGGQSLRAVQLVGRVSAELGVEFSLQALFERPTIAGMAETIAADGNGAAQPRPSPRRRPIPRRSAHEPATLSYAERRLWFFDQLQPNHPFYNMPVAARLVGPLDDAAFQRAVQQLVRRHESLRTVFVVRDGQPLRQVAATPETPFSRVDLRYLPPDRHEAELQRGLRAEARKPFDLAAGPLFRCVLYRVADQEHVVLLAMHHIVCDGWSVGVMAREMAALYEEAAGGRAANLPPLAVQYGDFAAWQEKYVRGEVLDREFRYWQEQLHDEPPTLDLPTDRPRPAQQSFEGATRRLELGPQLCAALGELARGQRTTLFSVLLAAYAALLGRYCRQEDIAVGTVVANRTRPELENLVGFFANTLVLRADLSGDPSFRELVSRVARLTLEAYRHQELPFDKLVELLEPHRHGNRAPLFQVALVLENMPLELPDMMGVRVKPVHVDNGTSKYDLALLVSQEADRLVGHFEYCTALFDAQTIDRLAGWLVRLLEAAVEDPDRPISRMPLVDDAQRRRIACQLNAAAADESEPLCLHQLFERHAAATPGRTAVRDGHRELTYGELDRQADRFARYLGLAGVGPEQPVAVCLPRSAELVIAMLGVLKAGAAYAPLDPAQPAERLGFLLKDTGSPLVVTRRDLAGRLPVTGTRPVLLEDILADQLSLSSGETELGSKVRVDPRQLAYVMYTSGSTGRPKGVLIEHRGIANLIRGFSRFLGIDGGSRVLHFFSPSSDGSISDVFSALASGACLVVAGGELMQEEGGLQKLLQRERVTVATLTPSMLPMLRPAELPDLRTVCSVGEALSAEAAAQWSAGRRLVNGYGVTEVSCGACLSEVRGSSGPHPLVGPPLPGVQVYVLDEHLEPVPVGVVGEICLGGVQVGPGYLNRPELTARSFVPDPFRVVPGARLYRTGDLGRLRSDGQIEFLGRIDDQVNLRGHRVEPGEIAALLRQHPLVGEAAVVAREDTPGAPRLVAYVVWKRAVASATRELRAFLRGRLPAHMVPSAFVVLDRLPRTVQGKLDRRALPSPSADEAGMPAGHVAPRSEEEALVAEVWQKLLGVDRVGIGDNFFDLGGHSMLAVQVVAEIERRTGRRLPLAALFHEATVEHLARLLRQPQAALPESCLVPLQPEGRGRPLFCVHPAGGTVFCYRALAEHLGTQRPVYGLQAVGIDGLRPPHERMEEMTAHYAAAIRGVQPTGPYLLGGWSLGGILAFETARLLVEQGEPVGLLALLDATAMYPDRQPDEHDFLPMLMDFFPGAENLPLDQVQAMTAAEQLKYFLERASQAEIVAADHELAAARHVFQVFQTSIKALMDYRQKPYPGKVTLFSAEHQDGVWERTRDPLLGWGPWARGGVEVHPVPGSHIRMVHEPHVQVLAAVLRGLLDQVDPPQR